MRLRRIADQVAEVIQPFTPCGKGCSACCHMPALISEVDARLISEATGVASVLPQSIFDFGWTEGQRQAFFGRYATRPCPFLKDGACSIYRHRPVVCRVQHSLEDSPERCDAREGAPKAAAVDLTHMLLGEVRMSGRMMIYSDIREFFAPQG